VSLADCVLVATAAERGEAAATSDGDLLEMCADESVAVVVLPASDGSVWSRS
jgi:predicted nucleic acid-binding protein